MIPPLYAAASGYKSVITGAVVEPLLSLKITNLKIDDTADAFTVTRPLTLIDCSFILRPLRALKSSPCAGFESAVITGVLSGVVSRVVRNDLDSTLSSLLTL